MKVGGFLNAISRSRFGRVLFLLAVLVLLATFIPAGPPPPAASGPDEVVLWAMAVPLDEHQPARRRVGDLLFLRGWVLSSDEPRFGGISAMQVENGRVTAVSDAGNVLEFALPTRAGASPMQVRPLPLAAGADRRSRDTESLVIRGRQAWIGFESVNAVKRFDRGSWRLESAALPAAMRDWRRNKGAEAIVRLHDGRFLVFCEGRDNAEPFSPVLLFDGDPALPGTRAMVLRYRRPAGFRVTDADLLPDGRLLILNRRAQLLDWAASLVLADLPARLSGATIAGREIALLREPLTVDNMEALSVARENGRTIVRIASDDNFMPIQRTLLLEFALQERANNP